ncbi:MAG: hypothetical protein A7316_06845 [Candidatus Altiarchaeales archaeon WOR_SM1_86-2]|nr:MAG: hypothetical protein A7316_06845 [Candidatus Altiarchaeales archaeon WOR_SM1_86-2]ODS39958.1 MAG: hypothetical protein A7315_02765 [Candidatus Altiarchaeales archaeon WOR_SM1_79]
MAYVKVRKVGGSLVATIPKGIRESLNLHEDELVEMEIKKPTVDFFGALKGIGPFTKEDEYDIE